MLGGKLNITLKSDQHIVNTQEQELNSNIKKQESIVPKQFHNFQCQN